MFRFLLLAGLVFSGTVPAATLEERQDQHLSYFYKLGLPYAEPRGCGPEWPCSLVQDFNDDGKSDLAHLMEYKGAKHRGADRKLDLVIIYSQKESTELTHEIFSYVGKVNEITPASVYLGVQDKGPMKLPGGVFQLQYPGINIIPGNDDAKFGYHTIYWRGDRFYQIDKSMD